MDTLECPICRTEGLLSFSSRGGWKAKAHAIVKEWYEGISKWFDQNDYDYKLGEARAVEKHRIMPVVELQREATDHLIEESEKRMSRDKLADMFIGSVKIYAEREIPEAEDEEEDMRIQFILYLNSLA